MNTQRLFLFENASHQCLELCGRSGLKLGCVLPGTKVSCSTTRSWVPGQTFQVTTRNHRSHVGAPPGNVDICACPEKDYKGTYDVWVPGP